MIENDIIEVDETFQKFEKYVKNWIEFFGLYNWEIGIHTDDGDDGESLAFTTFVVDNRRADIFLCDDWDGVEKTENELDKLAFHEVCEILLYKIRHLAGKRYYSWDEVDGEIHSVIRILTAKIFEKNK